MGIRLRAALAAVLLVAAVASAHAQASGGALTLPAQRYLKAEQRLEELLNQGPSTALEQLLAPDFSVRDASGTAFDRRQWLGQQALRARRASTIRDIEVRTVGEVSVVSFVRVDPQTGRRQWVVDVWSEVAQQLLSRHESPGWAGKADRPGRPAEPMRPDGKG